MRIKIMCEEDTQLDQGKPTAWILGGLLINELKHEKCSTNMRHFEWIDIFIQILATENFIAISHFQYFQPQLL
jgi:hypothetical protein